MKKTMFLSFSLFVSFNTVAEYNVIINSEHNIYQIEKKKEPIHGYIIDLYSINNSSFRDQHDVTETTNSNWTESFGLTKDLVLNEVSSFNEKITKTGIINWFDPEKKMSIEMQQACQSNDLATSDIEYIDKDNNTIFWIKSRNRGAYGTDLLYGKKADFSDINYTGTVALYPIVHGDLIFNIKDKTVSFDAYINHPNYNMEDWVLSNVEVDKIEKIRLSSSSVMTTYGGSTCGAQVRMKILKN